MAIDSTLLAQQFVNGLTIGGIYALVALGYTMVYGIIGIINFAHGDVYMIGAHAGLGAMIVLGAIGLLGSSFVVTLTLVLVVGIVSSALLGATIERVAYRPVRHAPRAGQFITAIGVSIFLQNAILVATGPLLKVYPDILPVGSLDIFGVPVTYVRIFIMALCLVLMASLYVLVKYTETGRAMRAIAEDRDTAALMGIDADRIVVITFLIGSALAGAAGVMVGMYYIQINHMMGFVPGLKAFTAAILGGIGNIPGAMLGGLLLGVTEALGAQILPMEYKDALSFGILILVLVLRPGGLLGKAAARRS